MITVLRNGPGEWCVGRQEGQHNLGIRRTQGNADWIWVSGCKPCSLDDIARLRTWSTAGYINETQLRRLLTIRAEYSRK